MELLSPAGNLEKLKAAVRFGADAVYCAAGPYSLRAPETSFSLTELAEGVSFAHEHNCKVYLAMNIFAFDDDLEKMISYLKEAVLLGIDAVIVSDPGVLLRISQLGINIKVHLSTQANTTNSDSVKFWQRQGVQRVVLARELSLSKIEVIKDSAPEMELEILVHGAMCIAYSGRCLLSKFMTGHSANRGHCTQSCRWEYHLRETTRPKEEQTISEDNKGTYILNSRDLCMIEHIPEIAAAGIASIKIEGRMKSAYYAAAVTRVYRTALNSFYDLKKKYIYEPEWLNELKKVSHRPYTTGFYLPELKNHTEHTADSSYVRGYSFVGIVDEHNQENNCIKVLGRNHIALGDVIEVLDPNYTEIKEIQVGQIIKETGERLEAAHNGYVVYLPLKESHSEIISKHALLRKKN